MRIKIINPIISEKFNEEVKQEFKHYVSPNMEVSVTNLDYGPASIESEYDEALCVPNFLEKAKEAEEQGFDGVVSNCFGDPGVKPAREILDIPVVGAGESSMLYASLLADSFTVLSVLPNVYSTLKNISKKLGVYENLASIRTVNIPVLEVDDKDRLKTSLYNGAIKAIEEDKAHALILGCTGMMGVAASIQGKLKLQGYDVPVIDPAFAATKMLEGIITMGIKQSRITYMTPPEKIRTTATSV